jgi:hypothetical protein
VYFGIIASKLGIIPIQNPHFYAWYPEHFYKMELEQFTETIAIHGFDCEDSMVHLWTNRNLTHILKKS